MHVGQWSAFHTTVRPEEDGLLNIEIGEQHDWSQVLFTDESQFSLESDIDVFLYGGTGALEITPHSFVKDHNTEELVDGMGWNQHRRTYGPAYHSEWHFDGPKVCRRDFRPYVITLEPLEIPLFSRMIMPDRIELVWWRTCLKSVCNGQRALLT
ncbi:hypothetical protein TNCV_711821 [Trichonephila clavipes]|nr:hypothetical protein TNCV_711821 [Trichonephila clavipes]